MRFLLVILLSVPVLVNANSIKWEMNQHGAGVVFTQNEEWMAGLWLSGSMTFYNTDKCYKPKVSDKVQKLEVNGVMVNFSSGCGVNGYEYISPKSAKGLEYVVNEFKNKVSVKIGAEVYTANGFNAVLKQQNIRKERNKNAL